MELVNLLWHVYGTGNPTKMEVDSSHTVVNFWDIFMRAQPHN